MRVVLCCLAKNEHLYINDFVKWYLNIGVDHIYIYDNDDLDNDKNIIDSIDNNICKRISVIDIRGKKEKGMHQHIFTEFYKQYGNTFDWCIFVDVDEFLINVPNIKFLLSMPLYKGIEQIRVKWLLYGDDDLIERNMNKPVYKAFKKVLNKSLNRNLIDKGNLESQGKAIVRGKLKNVVFASPHFASYGSRENLLKSCLPSGRACSSHVVINENYNYEAIYLKHFMTKSLSEFINQKIGRGDAVFDKCSIDMSYYWRINTKTKEKLEYLDKLGIDCK